MDNQQLSNRIKHLAKQQQITLKSLIDACNLSKSFIYDLEKRNASPSADKLYNIARFLNCSVDYLLGITDISDISLTPPINNIANNSDEEELLEIFRQLSARDKVKILDFSLSILNSKN